MTRDILTTEVMRRLPEASRPNPAAIAEAVHAAVSNGWDPAELAATVMRRAGATAYPGSIVIKLRELAQTKAPKAPKVIPNHGPHRECRYATHDPACIACYCHGMPEHYVPISPLSWWVAAKNELIAAGKLPE